MWKKIVNISLKLYDLTRTVDRHTRQITTLEQQVAELQESFKHFSLTYEKDREREETERRLLLVQVENLLLRQKLEAQEPRKELPPAPHLK